MRANPKMKAQVEATLDDLEKDFYELLKREDASRLLLSEEELEPWFTVWSEKLNPSNEPDPEPPSAQAFQEIFCSIVEEMADAIFTADRVKKFGAQLKQYAQDLAAAGEKITSGQVMWMQSLLGEKETETARSLVVSVCFVSFRKALQQIYAPSENDS